MVSTSVASSDEDPFALEWYLELPKQRSLSLSSASSGEDPFRLEKYVRPTSMVDRKIGTRGLSSSFTSNIGSRRRGQKTPTRTDRASKASDDSRKKVIYSWLETTNEPASPKYFQTPKRDRSQTPTTMSTVRSKSDYDREPIRTYATPANISFAALSESPLSRTPTAPESYELNFLNYVQFFNNRPLYRCLDDDQPEGEFFKREPKRPSSAVKSADGIPPIDPVSHKRQDVHDRMMANMAEAMGESGAAYSDSEYSEEQEEKRQPEAIHKFWDHVRLQLWISEEELDRIGEEESEEQKEEEGQEEGQAQEQAQGVSVPSSPTTKTQKTNVPRTPSPTPWVMMAAPTKWSYTSSMDRGNIYLGEHYPLVPYPPSRPRSLGGTDTDKKTKVEGPIINSKSGAAWEAHQQQARQKELMMAAKYSDYLDYKKDHEQTTEKMASFDEFLATFSPTKAPHRARPRRPTF
ncbi:hypothetical protein SLS62_003837 [Diatrype stigma]|uniref:Uncharacterized protein n=1 Tax=Diatrype stigma TaxID=117547 RepID=A0AAN9V4D5_9PEZI